MNLAALLVAAGIMAALGVGLSSVLALANRTLYVLEDPRIDTIEEMLPGANCGACGLPGCRAAAESMVAGEVSPSMCTVNSTEMTAAIAEFLGVEAGAQEKRVARLACAGGADVAETRTAYQGIESCGAAALISGGGKACPWGCLGYGDCVTVCPFDAITMNENRLPVVDEEQCTGCGNCVDACPKDLFSVEPVSHRLWVACKNCLMGKAAKAQCDVACTGCGICAKDAPQGLVEMSNNLAVIDYGKNDLASLEVIQRCPTGAIVWMDKERGPVKGAKATAQKAPQAAESV